MIKTILKLAFQLNIPGVGHFTRFLYRHHLNPYISTQLKTAPDEAKKGGTTFRADFRQHTDQIILRTGEYEPEVANALIASLGECGVFWDIGANTGYHSILIMSSVPRSQVVSFEPNPEVFFRLTQNKNINSFDSLSLPIALGSEVKVQRLHVVAEGNSGLTTLKPNSSIRYDSSISTLTLTGNFVVENTLAPVPHVIKIDTEGFELDVLKGMNRIMQSGALHTIIFEALSLEELNKIEKYLGKYNFSTPISIDKNHNFISKLNTTLK